MSPCVARRSFQDDKVAETNDMTAEEGSPNLLSFRRNLFSRSKPRVGREIRFLLNDKAAETNRTKEHVLPHLPILPEHLSQRLDRINLSSAFIRPPL